MNGYLECIIFVVMQKVLRKLWPIKKKAKNHSLTRKTFHFGGSSRIS